MLDVILFVLCSMVILSMIIYMIYVAYQSVIAFENTTNTSLQTLQTQAKTDEGNIATTQTGITTLQTQAKTDEGNIATTQQGISTLQTQAKTDEANIVSVNDSLGKQIASVQSDLSTYAKQTDLTSLNTQISGHTTALSDLSQQLQTAQKANSTNQNSISSLSQQVASLSKNTAADFSKGGSMAGNLTVPQLCINNTCITQQQLQNLLNPTSSVPSGRYVKVFSKAVQCLNIVQIQVFSTDGTTNVALKKPATMSSGWNGGAAGPSPGPNPPSYVVDGTMNNLAHSSCVDAPWLTIDLGSVMPITKIVVYSRKDCCSGRMVGFAASILDASQNVLWTSDVFTNKAGLTTNQNDMSGYTYYTMTPPSTKVTGT